MRILDFYTLRSSFSIGVVCGGHVGSVMVPYRPGVTRGSLMWYPIASAVCGGRSGPYWYPIAALIFVPSSLK